MSESGATVKPVSQPAADAFPVPTAAVNNPGLWTAESLQRETVNRPDAQPWITHFEAEVMDEILSATHRLIERGYRAPEFSIEQFPAPKTRAYLKNVSNELEQGKGFMVLRGLDSGGFSTGDLEDLFWGLGCLLGTAVPINADGALMGHVTDLGYDLDNPKVRNYQTREELSFHNDSCDVLGLLCVRQAKAGGGSAIASAIAVHNEILETRPDLLHELYQPMAIDRRGEKGWPAEGDNPWFSLPVFSYCDGKVTARYTVHDYYLQAQRFDDSLALNARQLEALDYLKQVCLDPGFHVQFQLQPGDIQLLNNYCVFHSRTHYEDYPEPERKRLLLRLWLSTPDSRRLHPCFSSRYRSAEPGAVRGGIAPREPGT